MPDGGWTTHRLSGTVGELHGLDPDPDVSRQVWLMSPLDTALVLGSAQPVEVAGDQVVSLGHEVASGHQLVTGHQVAGSHEVASGEGAAGDLAADHPAVVRRRSGGGAVLVVPGDSVWIDMVIDRADPLWDDDINRAPMWLGRVWVAALAALGIAGGEVVDRYQPGIWGQLACFASRGPGEVVVDGAKAVGLSQRRTRTTARFQTLLYRHWAPEDLVARLTVLPAEIDDLRATLTGAARPVDASIDDIHTAFVASLPH